MPDHIPFPDRGVYFVWSSEYRPDLPPLEVVRQALDGGITVLQLREKTMPRADYLAYARQARELCRARGVCCIINDDPELAVAVDADGVHIGQEDLAATTLARVRTIVGNRSIGLSTHSPDLFRAAQRLAIDYAAYGPLFPTKAKDYHIGSGAVPEVLAAAEMPAVFIGGIDTTNAGALVAQGAHLLAVIRAVAQASDIAAAVRKLDGSIAAGPAPVRVTGNGRGQALPPGCTIARLLAARGYQAERVVVEYNGVILARASWPATTLQDGDTLEIVGFVGGG